MRSPNPRDGEYLFIGGSFDGKVIKVTSPVEYHRLFKGDYAEDIDPKK